MYKSGLTVGGTMYKSGLAVPSGSQCRSTRPEASSPKQVVLKHVDWAGNPACWLGICTARVGLGFSNQHPKGNFQKEGGKEAEKGEDF